MLDDTLIDASTVHINKVGDVYKAGVMVEESIFIGDSIAHDVTGAQNIGMPVILYRPKENVNEIEWFQTEKGKCPVIAHFSQFFEAEKML